MSGLGVHGHRHRMTRIAESTGVDLRFIACSHLEPARIDVGRQKLRCAVPDVRHFGQRNRLISARNLDLAVFEHEVDDGHFEQFAGDLLDAFADLLGCRGHCAARHHHAARTPGAGRVGCECGIAMDEAHVRRVDAEDFIGHLCKCGLQALAVRLGTDAQFEHAIGRETRKALLVAGHHRNAPTVIHGSPVRTLLAINRDADTDFPSIGFADFLPIPPFGQIERGHRPAHRLGVVARVEMLVGDIVVGHILALHEILEAHLVRLASGGTRDRIDHELDCKAHAGACHAAIGEDARLVGRRRPGAAAIALHLVRAGEDRSHLGRFETRRKWIERIGA